MNPASRRSSSARPWWLAKQKHLRGATIRDGQAIAFPIGVLLKNVRIATVMAFAASGGVLFVRDPELWQHTLLDRDATAISFALFAQ